MFFEGWLNKEMHKKYFFGKDSIGNSNIFNLDFIGHMNAKHVFTAKLFLNKRILWELLRVVKIQKFQKTGD